MLFDENAKNAFVDVGRLIYCFNEDEAVWQRFEEKRELRRRSRTRWPIPSEVLDALDWRQANLEHQNVRCIGFPSD